MSFVEWLRTNYGYTSLNQVPSSMRTAIMVAYNRYAKNNNVKGYDDYLKEYQNGDMSAIDFQGVLANNGIATTPEQSQWLNNEISQQVTNEARDYNTEMRDSSITSSANQLQSLGLNPASVIQTGGAGIGSSPVSDTSKNNPALEKAMADFNQKAALTRTLVGLVGGLGSAGILGGSRALAQRATAAAASSAAHSGLQAIKPNYRGVNDKNWDSKWSDMMYMFD